jgi:hypothetical protein
MSGSGYGGTMKILLQEFAVNHGLKQEGGVIPGKHGYFFEFNGQI